MSLQQAVKVLAMIVSIVLVLWGIEIFCVWQSVQIPGAKLWLQICASLAIIFYFVKQGV